VTAAPAPSAPPQTDPPAPPPSASTAPSAGETPASLALSERTWQLESPFGPTEVVVLVPEGVTKAAPLPVLVAFHGRGESLKGPHRGARGWVSDYALGHAVERLGNPPLAAADFLGMVTADRLNDFNRALTEKPYRGLIVVCPFLPDVLKANQAVPEGQRLANFIADKLLPRVYAETPALGTPATTGVDGVSLGGRASLLVGFLRPEAFGVVAALQPALDKDEAGLFADLAKRAQERNSAQRVRLLTSDGDYFLEPTQLLAHALMTRNVGRRLDVATGPHNYEFNRGPGAFEMLLFHDRALRGDWGM
jgi:enterochelin esterase-like enzyme